MRPRTVGRLLFLLDVVAVEPEVQPSFDHPGERLGDDLEDLVEGVDLDLLVQAPEVDALQVLGSREHPWPVPQRHLRLDFQLQAGRQAKKHPPWSRGSEHDPTLRVPGKP